MIEPDDVVNAFDSIIESLKILSNKLPEAANYIQGHIEEYREWKELYISES